MDSNLKQCLDILKDKFSVLTMFADKVPAGDILCGLYYIKATQQQIHRWFIAYLASLDPRCRLSPVVFAADETTDTSSIITFVTAYYADFYIDCALCNYDIIIENLEFDELDCGADAIVTPYHELNSKFTVTNNAAITESCGDDGDSPIANSFHVDLEKPLSEQLMPYVECDADTLQTFAVKNLGQCIECSNILTRAGVRVWTAR